MKYLTDDKSTNYFDVSLLAVSLITIDDFFGEVDTKSSGNPPRIIHVPMQRKHTE